MITSVDEDSRHRDMPTLQNQVDVEKKQIEDRMNADLDRRSKKLEDDLKELEADGATAAAKSKVEKQANKEAWVSLSFFLTTNCQLSSNNSCHPQQRASRVL